MAIRTNDVRTPVQIDIDKQGAEFEFESRLRANSRRIRLVNKIHRVPTCHIQSGHFIREIADQNGQMFTVTKTGGINPHRPPCVALLIKSDVMQDGNFFKCSIPFVVKQEILNGVVGNKNIEKTIAIRINKGRSQ